MIILDEPDNNLDEDTLKALITKIIGEKKRRIIILISHDEKIIRIADEKIFIKNTIKF